MSWSKKYKKSIDCSNPKGFSQKAHCSGKKKRNENSMKLSEFKEAIRSVIRERSINAISKLQQKNIENIEKALEFWPNLKDTKIKYAQAKDAISLVQFAWDKKDFVSVVNWVPNYLKTYKPGKTKLGLPKNALKS